MARILIIEDEPILGLELSEDLQTAGHEVLAVEASGDMGMLQTVRHKPDLIIMDIKLHGFRDGIEAAAQIRGFFPTPIVYLTSYPYAEVSDRIKRTLPAWYLGKPYDVDGLMKTVAGVMDGSIPSLA